MFREFNWNFQTYKFWKPFIWLFVVLSVALGVYVLSLNNFSGLPYYYSYCPSNARGSPELAKCFNMFYHSNLCGSDIPSDDVLCSQEFIFAGESLGTRPPWITQNFYYIILILAVLIILCNHFIFNRDFRFPKISGEL